MVIKTKKIILAAIFLLILISLSFSCTASTRVVKTYIVNNNNFARIFRKPVNLQLSTFQDHRKPKYTSGIIGLYRKASGNFDYYKVVDFQQKLTELFKKTLIDAGLKVNTTDNPRLALFGKIKSLFIFFGKKRKLMQRSRKYKRYTVKRYGKVTPFEIEFTLVDMKTRTILWRKNIISNVTLNEKQNHSQNGSTFIPNILNILVNRSIKQFIQNPDFITIIDQYAE